MNSKDIINELSFKAIRSSGAGGQHVNKTSSKIELTFDLENSNALSKKEKERLKEKLGYAQHLNRGNAFDPTQIQVNEPGRSAWLRMTATF